MITPIVENMARKFQAAPHAGTFKGLILDHPFTSAYGGKADIQCPPSTALTIRFHTGSPSTSPFASIASESVDLIYLDPPFNSKATYNVGLLGESGRDRMRGRTAACSQKQTLQ